MQKTAVLILTCCLSLSAFAAERHVGGGVDDVLGALARRLPQGEYEGRVVSNLGHAPELPHAACLVEVSYDTEIRIELKFDAPDESHSGLYHQTVGEYIRLEGIDSAEVSGNNYSFTGHVEVGPHGGLSTRTITTDGNSVTIQKTTCELNTK